MSVAILTDTNSGIMPAEAEKLGIFSIPNPFYIDDKLYKEGVDIDHPEFYRIQEEGHEIHTSMVIVGDLLEEWNAILKDYDEVVYIPLSAGLSSSCQTAQMLSEDDEYDGKVFVVNNRRISVTQRLSVYEAKALADQGRSGAEIKKYLEDTAADSSIYIMVDTLKYLKQGGRVTPAAAAIGSLRHIKPILSIQGDKLDKFGMSRTVKQAKQNMLDAITKDTHDRFKDPDGSGCVISVAHTNNREAAEQFRDEILEVFPDRQIIIQELPIVIAVHTGPGTLACTTSKSFIKEIQ